MIDETIPMARRIVVARTGTGYVRVLQGALLDDSPSTWGQARANCALFGADPATCQMVDRTQAPWAEVDAASTALWWARTAGAGAPDGGD